MKINDNPGWPVEHHAVNWVPVGMLKARPPASEPGPDRCTAGFVVPFHELIYVASGLGGTCYLT